MTKYVPHMWTKNEKCHSMSHIFGNLMTNPFWHDLMMSLHCHFQLSKPIPHIFNFLTSWCRLALTPTWAPYIVSGSCCACFHHMCTLKLIFPSRNYFHCQEGFDQPCYWNTSSCPSPATFCFDSFWSLTLLMGLFNTL